MDRYAQVKAIAAPLLAQRKPLTPVEMQLCSDFVLFSCMVLIPPRRALDFAAFAIRDAAPDENTVVGKAIVFRKYKTASSYGVQRFVLPAELLNILTKWKRVNPQHWLLWMGESTRAPVSSDVTRRLNRIVRDGVSVNQMRHSFITDFYSGKTPTLEAIRNVSEAMAHAVVMNMSYRRIDAPDDSD